MIVRRQVAFWNSTAGEFVLLSEPPFFSVVESVKVHAVRQIASVPFVVITLFGLWLKAIGSGRFHNFLKFPKI